MRFGQPSRGATALVCLVLANTTLAVWAADGATATASSSSEGSEAGGAVDGNRFSVERASAWKGRTSGGRWWWQVEFERTRHVGAILQVVGDHPFVFRNAPLQFVWQRSDDGTHWSDLPETATTNERRLFRIHRLARAIEARFLRLNIAAAGEGTKTQTQCLRMNDRPIYAAQFHIEMGGAPEASKQLMGNFLVLAKAWGGYSRYLKGPPPPVAQPAANPATD